jgi:hypothetical protein
MQRLRKGSAILAKTSATPCHNPTPTSSGPSNASPSSIIWTQSAARTGTPKALLASQNEDGGWNLPTYPGANPTIDTCFALLFLKKANFVPGLTENLREYLRVRDPASP